MELLSFFVFVGNAWSKTLQNEHGPLKYDGNKPASAVETKPRASRVAAMKLLRAHDQALETIGAENNKSVHCAAFNIAKT